MQPIRQRRKEEIEKILGQKPSRNFPLYHKVWRSLFEGNKEKNREKLRIQRRRHLNHTGVANISRNFCIFCEQEKHE